MNSQSCQRQIIHWNIHTLNSLTSIVDLIDRAQKQSPPSSYDYKLRDFYFNPSFKLFNFRQNATFIEQSADLLKRYVSFNQEAYLQSLNFENHLSKHRFWNKINKMHIKSKEDHQAKQTVSNIVWTYRLIPISMFVFAGVTIMRLSGVYKMSLKKQIVGLISAAIMGNIFIRTKKSSEIFYLIPELQNPTLQQQRMSILNKSIVLDGKINQIQLHPKYVDELIDEADKASDLKEKKLILETAGYKIVDRVDYDQY